MSRAIFVKGELSSGIPLETQTLSAGKGELSAGIPAETQTLSAGKGELSAGIPAEKVLPSLFPCGYKEPRNSASLARIQQWQHAAHEDPNLARHSA